MYKKFFGLTRNPFEIAPDPFFLYATARHQEALASIFHSVVRRKGFVVLTGEVGTGKTLTIRCLLELLRRQEIASAYIFNPCLSRLDFLRYISHDLGVNSAFHDKGALLRELYSYLIVCCRKNTTAVVIVDEAQDLEPELLEEIRLLTNLETSQQKLLQIVLVGQPELDQKLDSPEFRHLKQRVTFRCQLEPLGKSETMSYVLRRMQRAGANSHAATIFPDETMAAIYVYSCGVPRLINTLCENALIAAYAQNAQIIRPWIIEEVAKDLRLYVVARPPVSPTVTNRQRAIARSMLQLVDELERVARGTNVNQTSTHEVKII